MIRVIGARRFSRSMLPTMRLHHHGGAGRRAWSSSSVSCLIAHFFTSTAMRVLASDTRSLMAQLATQEIETIRGLQYQDIGTVGGHPAGQLLAGRRTRRSRGAPSRYNGMSPTIEDPSYSGPYPANYRRVTVSVAQVDNDYPRPGGHDHQHRRWRQGRDARHHRDRCERGGHTRRTPRLSRTTSSSPTCSSTRRRSAPTPAATFRSPVLLSTRAAATLSARRFAATTAPPWSPAS